MKFINNSNDLSKHLDISIIKDILIKSISIDTRTIKKNELFVAINGINFNGNDYVEEAFKKGASIAIVDDKRFLKTRDKRIVYVSNSIQALKKISKSIIKSYEGKVIAITGSNGKTSTTKIIASALKSSSKTISNYNNEIGVPLSLMNASSKSKNIVLEIGASKFNDINYLSKLIKPHIGVITNIGNSHLEGLKNIDGVLKVKSELVKNIRKGGYLIVPNENIKHLEYWKKIRNDIEIKTFGMSKDADFYPTKINRVISGINFVISSKFIDTGVKIKTSLEGEHNIKNILAGFTTHYCLREEPKSFEDSINSKHFKNVRQIKSKWIKGSALINDTYNANPDSTKKSIDLFSNYKKTTVLVLGDMLELGRYRVKMHKEIGSYAKSKGIKYLLGYGDLTRKTVDEFGENGFFFNKEEDLKAFLKENITSKHVVLIKGSRGMKMERFIDV